MYIVIIIVFIVFKTIILAITSILANLIKLHTLVNHYKGSITIKGHFSVRHFDRIISLYPLWGNGWIVCCFRLCLKASQGRATEETLPLMTCLSMQAHAADLVSTPELQIRCIEIASIDNTCVISSPNPMFDHLLESSRWDDSNKWSYIWCDEEIGIKK